MAEEDPEAQRKASKNSTYDKQGKFFFDNFFFFFFHNYHFIGIHVYGDIFFFSFLRLLASVGE